MPRSNDKLNISISPDFLRIDSFVERVALISFMSNRRKRKALLMTEFVAFVASFLYVSTHEKLNLSAYMAVSAWLEEADARQRHRVAVVLLSSSVYASRYAKTIDQYAPATSYDRNSTTVSLTLSLHLLSNHLICAIVVKRQTLCRSRQKSSELRAFDMWRPFFSLYMYHKNLFLNTGSSRYYIHI